MFGIVVPVSDIVPVFPDGTYRHYLCRPHCCCTYYQYYQVPLWFSVCVVFTKRFNVKNTHTHEETVLSTQRNQYTHKVRAQYEYRLL